MSLGNHIKQIKFVQKSVMERRRREIMEEEHYQEEMKRKYSYTKDQR